MRHAISNYGNDPSDAELAQRIACADQQAFVLLMRRHNQRLFRTARSILHDDAESQDAVQDAWLHAWRAIAQYRGEASLSTWLTRIVVNEAIARERKSSRRAQVTPLYGEDLPLPENTEAGMDTGEPDTPERGAMRQEARALLEQALDVLPEAFRTVFMLRAVEEMNGEEVAACLGIPEATVRSRFFRARAMLRAALAREFDYALEEAFGFAGERCDRIVAAVLARLDQSRPGQA
ncbi:RNA polymerase sigma factor [Massilia horti]|uniref:RNA polymerase sigma factor n=1 Tax=Massilia horti TaxID=2562153 RepID=A0A4Y9T3Q3_9BURK|nr:RNA polymerase sigma factor [Massilia horti]TFW32160.1 RNA polymerase sigma factor [Massilia horti]